MPRQPSHHSQPLDTLPPALTILRTDTVFAKLPIHNLAKGQLLRIQIDQSNEQGLQDLYWHVSPSTTHGPPQQLAYKLDTLLINRQLDALKRPLPGIIRLGSLRHICNQLGLRIGKSIAEIKNAFHQNAGAYITAKVSYRNRDGHQRRLEAGFNRYGVVFTGETLPDGTSADAVYITLNESYRQVLNAAPTRPIDYDYLSGLKPLAQRFYELLSFKIFAALKYHQPRVTMRYSELCLYAPQQRSGDRIRMTKQMTRIHHPHLQSGYLATAETERIVDPDGGPDWLLHYTPGPKARAEYQAFTTGQHCRGRSSLPKAAGTGERVTSISDGSGHKSIDSLSADRRTVPAIIRLQDQCEIEKGDGNEVPEALETQVPPLPPTDAHDETPCGEGQARRKSSEPGDSRPHLVSPAPELSPRDDTAMQATTLVRDFRQHVHGVTTAAFHPKEIEHAKRLLAEYGPEFAAFFVDFACKTARQDAFTPNVFGGLLRYESRALSAYQHQQRRHDQDLVEEDEARTAQLRQHYRHTSTAKIEAYLECFGADVQAPLERAVRVQLQAETEGMSVAPFLLNAWVKAEVQERLAEAAGVPPFDQWVMQHRQPAEPAGSYGKNPARRCAPCGGGCL